MNRAIRYLLVLTLCAAALSVVLEPEERSAETVAPLLPVEAALTGAPGFCSSQALSEALRSDAFRWVARPDTRLWRRGLALSCQASGDLVRMTVSNGGKTPVWSASFRLQPGAEGEAATAAVIARLLWAQPRVAEAAVADYLDNQKDVARAGADLWRAKRWRQAADTLFSALESDWADETQAQLYFGLADAYAHLGKPRQAFWYALGYLALSRKEPPEEWTRGLRGAASLLSEQPSAVVEPEAQELARRHDARQAEGQVRQSFEDLKRLCQLLPWSEEYQLQAASVYDRLGWHGLSGSWKRRAAFTRRLAGDEALQRRLSALLR